MSHRVFSMPWLGAAFVALAMLAGLVAVNPARAEWALTYSPSLYYDESYIFSTTPTSDGGHVSTDPLENYDQRGNAKSCGADT